MVNPENVIVCLKSLADSSYQRRAWLSSSGPIVSSFSEDVSQLFDDTGLSDALEQGSRIFGDVIDRDLRALGKAVIAVDESTPPADLLDSDELANIRQIAASLLSRISVQEGD
jgi:heme oxygenase